MSIKGKILSSSVVNWLHKFIHLLKLDNSVHDTSQSDVDLSGTVIDQLLSQMLTSGTWSLGEEIDLVKDVLGWINDNLEELKSHDVIEVNVIQGDALSDFIKDNQKDERYKDISNFVLDSLINSVILVAIDKIGKVADTLMIRSNGGLSEQSLKEFHSQPILNLKFPHNYGNFSSHELH